MDHRQGNPESVTFADPASQFIGKNGLVGQLTELDFDPLLARNTVFAALDCLGICVGPFPPAGTGSAPVNGKHSRTVVPVPTVPSSLPSPRKLHRPLDVSA